MEDLSQPSALAIVDTETTDTFVGRITFSPRGNLMPQTPEQFQYMGDLYDKALQEKDREISRLKARVKRLEQKIATVRDEG